MIRGGPVNLVKISLAVTFPLRLPPESPPLPQAFNTKDFQMSRGEPIISVQRRDYHVLRTHITRDRGG
jgi:hypothetical protein